MAFLSNLSLSLLKGTKVPKGHVTTSPSASANQGQIKSLTENSGRAPANTPESRTASANQCQINSLTENSGRAPAITPESREKAIGNLLGYAGSDSEDSDRDSAKQDEIRSAAERPSQSAIPAKTVEVETKEKKEIAVRNGSVVSAPPMRAESKTNTDVSAGPKAPRSVPAVVAIPRSAPTVRVETSATSRAKAMGGLLGYSDSESDAETETKAPCPNCAADARSQVHRSVQMHRRSSAVGNVLEANAVLTKLYLDPSVKDLTGDALDGEELTARDLAPIAHKCGPGSWKWRVRDIRPKPRGTALGTRAKPPAQDDPDLDDFAFFASIGSSSSSSAPVAVEINCHEKPEEIPPPPPPAPVSEGPALPPGAEMFVQPPPPPPPPEDPCLLPSQSMTINQVDPARRYVQDRGPDDVPERGRNRIDETEKVLRNKLSSPEVGHQHRDTQRLNFEEKERSKLAEGEAEKDRKRVRDSDRDRDRDTDRDRDRDRDRHRDRDRERDRERCRKRQSEAVGKEEGADRSVDGQKRQRQQEEVEVQITKVQIQEPNGRAKVKDTNGRAVFGKHLPVTQRPRTIAINISSKSLPGNKIEEVPEANFSTRAGSANTLAELLRGGSTPTTGKFSSESNAPELV